MKKETLQQRLAVIEAELVKQQAFVEQATANLNMLQGGKQECLYWLRILELPDVETLLGIQNAQLVDT